MESQSWKTIADTYKNLPLKIEPKNLKRIEGCQYMITLIPYLQQNEVIDSGIRFLSHYSLVLMIGNNKKQVHIMPPGLIFSGSSSEFCVTIFDNKENKVVEQRLTVLKLDDVVKTTENYLLRIQQNKI